MKRSSAMKAAAGAPVAPPSVSNGSEKERKKKKKKNKCTCGQPASPRSYIEIGREDWRLRLQPDLVIKVSSVRNIAAGLEHHISSGNQDHGSISIGDEDGVWANLCQARLHIRAIAAVLCEVLAGKKTIKPDDCLSKVTWATPLVSTMEAAARKVLGADGDVMMTNLRSAIKQIQFANLVYGYYGDPRLVDLIEVYAESMGVISNMWLELCDLVHSKFARDRAASETSRWMRSVNQEPEPHPSQLDCYNKDFKGWKVISDQLRKQTLSLAHRTASKGPTEGEKPKEKKQQKQKKNKLRSVRPNDG